MLAAAHTILVEQIVHDGQALAQLDVAIDEVRNPARPMRHWTVPLQWPWSCMPSQCPEAEMHASARSHGVDFQELGREELVGEVDGDGLVWQAKLLEQQHDSAAAGGGGMVDCDLLLSHHLALQTRREDSMLVVSWSAAHAGAAAAGASGDVDIGSMAPVSGHAAVQRD